MRFFKRISTTFKTNENTASDKAEDLDEMSNQTMVDKRERPVTTKQQIATHLSHRDSIEKLNLMEHSFNALTQAGVQTVGALLKLVESGEPRAIPGLRSTSILEIEVKLAQLEIVEHSEVESNPNATPDQNDVPIPREVPIEESSLTQSPPNQLHVDRQAVREVEQQVESDESATISESDANVDTMPGQNSVSLSQEDSIAKLSLTRHTLNLLKHTDIRTVGDLLQWFESGRLQTIPALGRISILEIEDELARVPALDDAGADANSGATSTQNDVSFSQEDSTEEPSLPQHSPNPPIYTESQTVGEGTQHIESREDSTKKIKLTRDALNRLKQTDVRTVGELLQWVESDKSQTIPEGEADTNETSDQNDVALSREDSTEEPGLTQHTDSRTVREDKRKVESSEPPTISEGEADADVIPNQNDMYLSRGDAIEKLNLSRPSFNVLTGIGIRTVGEVLQLFESARPNMIRQAFGRKFTLEIRAKLAQVTVLDDSETEANANTTPEQNDVSFSREASTEEQSSTQHTNLRTVREGNQQVESDELSTISEPEADTNETSDQNDVLLSTEDSIEKLNLTEYSFNALTALGVKTVGEVLKLVESGEHRPISTLGRKFILEIEGKLAQVKILDDSETEVNTDSQTVGEAVQPAESSKLQTIPEGEVNVDAIPDQNDISLSQEDSTEEPSLSQHSPNLPKPTDSRTAKEGPQPVESGELQTITGAEAKTDTMPDQNDTYLSRGDAIEKLNLSQRSLNALKNADIWLVGEVLQLVELGRLRAIRGLGQKSISEIEKKLAQVRIHDNYAYLSKEDSIGQLNLRNRSFNAFTRAGIQTIGEVLKLVESGELQTIPALGRKSVLEVKIKLAQVKILNDSEAEANTDAMPGRDYGYLSVEDPIDWLDLTPCSFNVLMRANIQTIGELLQLVESDGLKIIRGLGQKSILDRSYAVGFKV